MFMQTLARKLYQITKKKSLLVRLEACTMFIALPFKSKLNWVYILLEIQWFKNDLNVVLFSANYNKNTLYNTAL